MNVKNFKSKAKDWWEHNKKLVGVGFTTMSDTVVRLASLPDEPSDDKQDEFIYDETNVDDPELLEMITDGSVDKE